MKKVVLGTFPSRERAEALIYYLYNELDIPRDDISYMYKNTEGEIKEFGGMEIGSGGEGVTTGAVVGGSLGALAGLAAVAGAIPVIGPIFAAGPLFAALGVGGAVGTAAAGALTGVIAGGVIGALVDLGASESEAREYEDRVRAGDVLVVVYVEDENKIRYAFTSYKASSVSVHTPVVT